MAARIPRPARGELRWVFLAGTLLACPPAGAAEPNAGAAASPSERGGHELGAGLVVSATQTREDLLAPLRFAGPGFGVSVAHDLRGVTWDSAARARVLLAVVSERYSTPNVLLLPALDFALHYGSAGTPGSVDVGLWLGLHQVLGYYVSWDDAYLYWFSTTGLGPSARATLDVWPRPLEVELHAPVVALVSRPPRRRFYKVDNLVNLGFWLGRFADDPELTSVHELQAASLRLTWRGSRESFRIDPWIELEGATYSKPVSVTHVSLFIGAEGRWGL